jgi:hypothetical protein
LGNTLATHLRVYVKSDERGTANAVTVFGQALAAGE